MPVLHAFTKAHDFIACDTDSLAITMMPGALVLQLRMLTTCKRADLDRIASELLQGMAGIGQATPSQYAAYVWLWSHHGHLFNPKLDA